MPPPKVEEDFDDLDDVLDDFTGVDSKKMAVPSEKEESTPITAIGAGAAGAQEDFPDPEDEPLDPSSDEAIAAAFEAQMAKLLGGLGDSGDVTGARGLEEEGEEGDDGQPGGEDDDAEFQRIMQELMKSDMMAGLGMGGNGANGGEVDPEALLAALMGGPTTAGLGPGVPPAPMSLPDTGSSKGKKKERVASSSKGIQKTTSKNAPPSAAAPVNFQDTIASTMNKMRSSSTTVDAETEAKRSSEPDPLAAMLSQLSGLDLNGAGGEEGLQGMLDEMMDQLMSRDLLYDPLKELASKYPAYLEENKETLSVKDTTRYKKQLEIVQSIVDKFEEPGANDEPPFTASQEQERKARSQQIMDLVGKMNECGAPPTEIMGEMPPGMELGADGVPKMPEECIVS